MDTTYPSTTFISLVNITYSLTLSHPSIDTTTLSINALKNLLELGELSERIAGDQAKGEDNSERLPTFSMEAKGENEGSTLVNECAKSKGNMRFQRETPMKNI